MMSKWIQGGGASGNPYDSDRGLSICPGDHTGDYSDNSNDIILTLKTVETQDLQGRD